MAWGLCKACKWSRVQDRQGQATRAVFPTSRDESIRLRGQRSLGSLDRIVERFVTQLKRLGLRLDNFWAALARVLPISLLAAGVSLVAGYYLGTTHTPENLALEFTY